MSKNNKLVEVYSERFINRTDVYNLQWANAVAYGYTTTYGTVTTKLLRLHLAGTITLATFALSKENTCKWCCWDSDKQDGKLDKLHKVLVACGWRVIREGARPGRDGHLWMFFSEPVPAEQLRRFAAVFEKAAGIKPGELEFFPKQNKLTAKRPLGSSVRLPLGVHRKPRAGNVRGWFEDAPREVLAQLKWFVAQPVNEIANFKQLSEKLRLRALINKKGVKSKSTHNNTYLGIGKLLPRQSILNLLANVRQVNNGFIAQCPLCAAEGHDKHNDNLHISPDGKMFCCVYGGPGQIHKAFNIVTALKQPRSTTICKK